MSLNKQFIMGKSFTIYKTLLIASLILIPFYASFADRFNGPFSLEQSIRQVKQRTQGEVISAETITSENNDDIYHIRVLTNEGKVKRFRVKKKDGRFLQRKRR